MSELTFGPILQFRGAVDGKWTVSALFATPVSNQTPSVTFSESAKENNALVFHLGNIPLQAESPKLSLWRADIDITPDQDKSIRYRIGNFKGSFHVPMPGRMPRIAYGSCNGFSSPKLMKDISNKNERWEHLYSKHITSPYDLLVLGGDQVYSDSMWEQVPSLKRWSNRTGDDRWNAKWTQDMAKACDSFFANLYIDRWNQPFMRDALASIPSIMMWDDHDIFDGWGSYPTQQHSSPVFQGIFGVAQKYFRLFQLQCGMNQKHPSAIATSQGNHLAFKNIGELALLVPDLRTERSPNPDQIISPESWECIYEWLDSINRIDNSHKHLLLFSSIPIAYLDLGILEKTLNVLPGQQELEDDLRDHWRSVPNLQERKRLIHRLFTFARDKKCRVTIVSGDVHVGALGVIETTRDGSYSKTNIINQLVSTGIVHPAPPALARYVLESIADRVEIIDTGITASMQPISGRGSYLIGARNWLALEPDEQGRIWANWHVEGVPAALTKVIHPA